MSLKPLYPQTKEEWAVVRGFAQSNIVEYRKKAIFINTEKIRMKDSNVEEADPDHIVFQNINDPHIQYLVFILMIRTALKHL